MDIIDALDDDALRQMCLVLPLTSLPAAACVSRRWRDTANQGAWQAASTKPLQQLRGRSASLLCTEDNASPHDDHGDLPEVVCGDGPRTANELMMREQALNRFGRAQKRAGWSYAQHSALMSRLLFLYAEFEDNAIRYTETLANLHDHLADEDTLNVGTELLPLYATLLLPAIRAAVEPLSQYESWRVVRAMSPLAQHVSNRQQRDASHSPLEAAHAPDTGLIVPTIAFSFDDHEGEQGDGGVEADAGTRPPAEVVRKVGTRLTSIFLRFSPLLLAHRALLLERDCANTEGHPQRNHAESHHAITQRHHDGPSRRDLLDMVSRSNAAFPPRWNCLLRDLGRLMSLEADLLEQGSAVVGASAAARARERGARGREAELAVDRVWRQLNEEMRRCSEGTPTSRAHSESAGSWDGDVTATVAQWLRGWVSLW